MVVKKENIIYPYQTFAAPIAESFHGKQAAYRLHLEYSKPDRQKVMGVLNILSCSLCFLVAIIIIVGILRDLQSLLFDGLLAEQVTVRKACSCKTDVIPPKNIESSMQLAPNNAYSGQAGRRGLPQ